ncbi:hypothetical protein [Sphingomonas yantingensis]|uniref:Uncharacterized protein n=1 Tax=Sphingomonas yantingensis TaxID=1241761 RepID=A0A7W9AM09_9SPHN|nr:hypothetical protein [Sphingomonas yantingensis]MBB5696918.1 hypothetical protein [Sphingomonas yantingensis]
MTPFLFVVAQSTVPVPISAPPAPPSSPPPIVRGAVANGYPFPRPARRPTDVAVFDVEISGAGQRLWRGALRVSDVASASFEHRERNAPGQDCEIAWAERGETKSISLNINAMRGPADTTVFMVRAVWERPGDGSCDGGYAQRSVSVSDRLAIPRGGDAVLRGDAGFEIRLKRR